MTRPLILLAAAGLAAMALLTPPEGDTKPKPAPVRPAPPPLPEPFRPRPKPCPGPGPCPRELVGGKVGGRVAPDGEPVQCDLPHDRWKKNVGGSDGAGLCVFTSIGHAADWASVPELADFQTWMRRHPGGGYPDKVDKMVARKCQELGRPVPQYLNVEGATVELIEAATAAGLMVSITYNHSPTGRYGGGRIAHMVNVVHAKNGWYGVLDNNYVDPDAIEWLDRREFQSVDPSWVVILLSDGPPPPPKTQAANMLSWRIGA